MAVLDFNGAVQRLHPGILPPKQLNQKLVFDKTEFGSIDESVYFDHYYSVAFHPSAYGT